MPESTMPTRTQHETRERLDSFAAGLASGAAGDFTGRGPSFEALKRVRPDRYVTYGQAVGFVVQITLIGVTILLAAHDSAWIYLTGALVVLNTFGASALALRICQRRPDYLRSRRRQRSMPGTIFPDSAPRR